MYNNDTNYSGKERKKRKAILIIVTLAVAAILLIGVTAAFYSDLFTQKTGDIGSGTLELDGSYTFSLNGSEPVAADAITNMIPGDVLVIRGTVSNIGSESAWIREVISITNGSPELMEYLLVYNEALTQEDLLVYPDYAGTTITLVDGNAAGIAKVIDGTADTAREAGGSYDFLDDTTYSFVYTVYFSHHATNDVQNMFFKVGITTQALQFRNNNANVPAEAAWPVEQGA